MNKIDLTIEELSSKQRHYKIGYLPNQGEPNKKPQLILSGKWLATLGFTIGTPIKISLEMGQLIIQRVELE
ncbi:SymE family type I addiction module toxin [Moellerella wisconsensis]|uniref:SymE family toxin n=1 Tax=Moellerella wisconsensis ATCC 35017 TaxID=1354267 RepID=A0A0N0IC48_9GAMM|nr:SymE family type I addiction module toxin [Moellerella wisconsensis]KPD04181.1 SymE family toxin [Moellerella wisconsensis ATCC 35017]VFS52315.1 HSP20-like domain of uncharacterised function (DUF1813) [Moellerella wisconsensis]